VRNRSFSPNSQAGEAPLVGYPQSLTHCIHSFSPHLETISSFCNLRTRHAAVTTDPIKMGWIFEFRALQNITSLPDPVTEDVHLNILKSFLSQKTHYKDQSVNAV
jgi:hypothetical protein